MRNKRILEDAPHFTRRLRCLARLQKRQARPKALKLGDKMETQSWRSDQARPSRSHRSLKAVRGFLTRNYTTHASDATPPRNPPPERAPPRWRPRSLLEHSSCSTLAKIYQSRRRLKEKKWRSPGHWAPTNAPPSATLMRFDLGRF